MRKWIDLLESATLTELSRPPLMQNVGRVLARGGWNNVSMGFFADVYAKEGKDYILKVFSAEDKGYIAFLQLIQRFPNPHWPRIIGKPIQITKTYWATRMEKLTPQPIASELDLGVYLDCRDLGPDFDDPAQVGAYDYQVEFLSHYPELAHALDLIHDHLLPHWSQDLHPDNLMQRSDGTMVITDPVGWAK